LVTVAVVLVAAAIGALAWLHSDTADPVEVDDVVGRFDDSDGEAIAPSGVVGPGVYVYATTGSEEVDALGGSAHDYPAETTMSVTVAPAGCVTIRWDALRQRWDSRTVCPDAVGGWTLQDETLFHSFFRQDETRTYACEPGAVEVPADLASGATFTSRCDSEGSGQSGSTGSRTTGTVIGIEEVEIAGEPRPAVHLRYTSTVIGETEGEATVDRWLSLEAMPLVLREVAEGHTNSDTVIGTVTYEESYEIVLNSQEPRT
jgi:hypothetical protein